MDRTVFKGMISDQGFIVVMRKLGLDALDDQFIMARGVISD